MIAVLFVIGFAPMILEARVSRRHERVLRHRRAVEPPGDVYALMQLCYPGAFVLMLLEGFARGVALDALFFSGAAVFLGAKVLKYWAIHALGERWTFRVLVPVDSSLVRHGPYGVLDHPNYVAVIGELAGFALMAHAWITGPIATALFALLIRARIRVEERALGRARHDVHHGS
jgi:methyltransferase